jgi:hypothetical protein
LERGVLGLVGRPGGCPAHHGGIAATIGQPSWVVWIVSILMGFIQSFVYAEIAGLYPHKSGGASVYGAAAWLPYSRFVAPISIWANWLAWSPVLTLATSLAAGYIMASLFAPDAAIMAWQIKLVDLGFVRPGSACGSTPSRSSPPASCCSLSCCSMAGQPALPMRKRSSAWSASRH